MRDDMNKAMREGIRILMGNMWLSARELGEDQDLTPRDLVDLLSYKLRGADPTKWISEDELLEMANGFLLIGRHKDAEVRLFDD